MALKDIGRTWFVSNSQHIAEEMEKLRRERHAARPHTAFHTYNLGFRWLSEMQLCDVWEQLPPPHGFRVITRCIVHQVFQGLTVNTKHLYAIGHDETILCITPGEFILGGLTEEPFVAQNAYELQPGERIARIAEIMPHNVTILPQLCLAALIATRSEISKNLWLDYSEETE